MQPSMSVTTNCASARPCRLDANLCKLISIKGGSPPIADGSHPDFENEFHHSAHSHRQAPHAVNHPSRCPVCSEYGSEELRCGIGDPWVLAELGSRGKGNREANYAHHSIERLQMRPRRREGVQGGEM